MSKDPSEEMGDDDEEEEDEDEDDDEFEEEDDDEDDNNDEQFEDAEENDRFLQGASVSSDSSVKQGLSPYNPKSSIVCSSSSTAMIAPLMSTGMNCVTSRGVLVLTSGASSITNAPTRSDDESQLESAKQPRDLDNSAPMDLSVKRPSVLNLSVNANNSNCSAKSKPFESINRLGQLQSHEKFSMSELGSPTTPIREHPSEILSPVTDSSILLKSIYNTTLRVATSTNRSKQSGVSLPSKETGHMLQAYLKERAVLDTTMKRHQYHLSPSSSDNSPDSPHSLYLSPTLAQISSPKEPPSKPSSSKESNTTGLPRNVSPASMPSSSSNSVGLTFVTSVVNFDSENTEKNTVLPSTLFPSSIASKLINTSVSAESKTLKKCAPAKDVSAGIVSKKEKINCEESVATNSQKSEPGTSCSSSSGNSSCTTNFIASVAGTSRMPTPPANLTVLNSCGADSKTAFLAPSGVIPSSTNR